MTDRVIEIRLIAPRPNLLQLLAQPELAIVRDGAGHRPVHGRAERGARRRAAPARARSSRRRRGSSRREEVLLAAARPRRRRSRAFAAGKADLVLGGTFADLPLRAARQAAARRAALRSRSGLFGLVPVRAGGALDEPDVRRLLSQAIDRDALVAALGVPGLVAARDAARARARRRARRRSRRRGSATPIAERRAALARRGRPPVRRTDKPTHPRRAARGPGRATSCSRELARDWGALGLHGRARRDPARRPISR